MVSLASHPPGTARPPRRLFAAALVSRVSNEMTPVAIVLLVLGRGESLALAGVTAGALALPGIVSGPLVGAWLDRARRPLRVIGAEQAGGAAGLGALVLLVGHVPAVATLALALATGVLQPLSTGGMTSLLTGHADEGEIPRASSLEAASFGAANVAGPLLAGVTVALAGAPAAVGVQAALKVVAMVTTLGAEVPGPDPSPEGSDTEAARPPIGDTVRAGFRHFAASGPLAAITATGAIAMAGRGLLVVAFPLFALDVLGRAEDFAGYLWAAFAAGSALGALWLPSRLTRWSSQTVALGGAGLAGLAMLPLSILDSSLPALVTLALAGALYGPSLAATFDVRRRFTPPAFLGQVFTTAASVKTGSLALGTALSGALVAAVGVPETILVAASLHLAATAVGMAMLKARGGTSPAHRSP